MKQIFNPSLKFITPACAEKGQQKLLKDGFAMAGAPMDEEHWVPVSMAQEDINAVFEKVKAALEKQEASSWLAGPTWAFRGR